MRAKTGAGTAAQPPRPRAGVARVARAGSIEQFRWFTTLFVMAAVVHYTDSVQLRDGIPILLVGLPVLVFPANPWIFGLFLAATGVSASAALPTPANHTMLALLVVLAFAAATLWQLAASTPGRQPFTTRWVDAVRVPVGLTLLVVYFFAVFHKLNTAFFDPAHSCAGFLLGFMTARNGLGDPQLPAAVILGAAIATVIIEAVVLVLIAWPRLRCWGLLLGVGFHAVLAPASFWDFATIVFALYLLLIPAPVFAGLAARFVRARRIALAAFAAHLMVSIAGSLAPHGLDSLGLRWHTLQVLSWYVIVVALMVPLIRACLAGRPRRGVASSAWPGWRLRPAALLIVPLLAFLNGAAPYLGWKTVSSYSMFSNLHTERGTTNHVLPWITHLQVAGYQSDTVTLTRIEVPQHPSFRRARWPREGLPVTVPWLELRRTVLLWKDAGVREVMMEYQHGGTLRAVADVTTDPVLAAPLPGWQRHLLAFRAIDSPLGYDQCRW